MTSAIADDVLIDVHCHRASAQGVAIVSVDMSGAAGWALYSDGDAALSPAPLIFEMPSGASGSKPDTVRPSTNSGRPVFEDRADNGRYFSLGMHPWFIERQAQEIAFSRLERLAAHPKVLAIGECGLDKCIATPPARQAEVFSRHIELSEAVGKPLIIHCVRAFAELLQLKKRFAPRQAWIVHGFTGKPALAKQLLQHGCYLSFGKAILLTRPFHPEPVESSTDPGLDTLSSNGIPLIDSTGSLKSASQAAEALKIVPPERLFLETDAAIDVSIGEIYAAAAKILGLDLAELERRIASNFNRVFPHD
ncbi:TatD family hydrolase [Methylomonas rhizoryzae]|uniref:TatD family hydrolase n=1 Tax=Methylomonas rhizoryzae TaxID=2608981 RepID=UPI001E37AE5F|nr:TatD family hydrolase [Methylomonas rhizoryzae]